ncbi:30 kDa heat shock protein [Tieghemiomyces parasiticus]|uniref:30 kDa heat shock protein n=1 Tax=Tieghemiomyces parasiticus TaxID=78921 RepID=A0A9W7ZIW6_9FUNG|nr:30 kDa heat shock protein [Tieghemiomyces parasiticus]
MDALNRDLGYFLAPFESPFAGRPAHYTRRGHPFGRNCHASAHHTDSVGFVLVPCPPYVNSKSEKDGSAVQSDGPTPSSPNSALSPEVPESNGLDNAQGNATRVAPQAVNGTVIDKSGPPQEPELASLGPWADFAGLPHRTPRPTIPEAHLMEDRTSFYLEIELPGIPKNNVNVQWEGGHILVVQAKSTPTAEAKDTKLTTETNNKDSKAEDVSSTKAGSPHLVSITTARHYRRRFDFPAGITPEAIQARFQDGLLTVTVPKTPEAKRTIRVEA